MQKKRFDWRFAAMLLAIAGGTVGGWVSIAREVQRALPLADIAAGSERDGWEPIGSDSEGREFLRRTASNGDIERLTIMGDGVGLYVRCEAPDPFPDVSNCAKIILRPRQ